MRIVPFMLRNIWTAGLLLFAAVMMSTFFIKTVWQVCQPRVTNLQSGVGTAHLIGNGSDRRRRDLLGYRMLGVCPLPSSLLGNVHLFPRLGVVSIDRQHEG